MPKYQSDLKEKREEVKNIRIEEIVVPERLMPFTDEKRGVRSVAFPFQLGDGVQGIITITKLKTGEWFPHEDIEKIQLYIIRK